MSESNNLPQAISHKKLSYLMLKAQKDSHFCDELSEICDKNEINAAKDSLNSELIRWQDGKKVICREWIKNLLVDLSLTAEKFNMIHLLKPIYKVLDEGNQSMSWIKQYRKGFSIEEIMKNTIKDMIKTEEECI